MGETEEYSKWERMAETVTRILTPVLRVQQNQRSNPSFFVLQEMVVSSS